MVRRPGPGLIVAGSLVRVQDGPRELRAAVLALRQLPTDVRRIVGQDMRTTMAPEWRGALAQAQRIPQDAVLFAGARIGAGNPAELVTASGRRRVGRGLVPLEHWPGFEYGASDHTPRAYTRNRAGYTQHTVRRDVLAGHPPRYRTGRVIGPTVRAILPRVAAYWTQSIIRAALEAAEKGR